MGNFLRLCEVVVKKIKRKGERKTAFSCCSLSAHVRPESQESGREGAWSLVFFQYSPRTATAPQSPRKPSVGLGGAWVAAQDVLCTPACSHLPDSCPPPRVPAGARAAILQPSRFFYSSQPADPCLKRVGLLRELVGVFAWISRVAVGVRVKRNKKFIRLIGKGTGGGRGKQRS